MTIERVESRLVYSSPDNPWVSLYFDDVRFPDGTLGRYNRVVDGTGHDGVAILPVRDGKALLLNIFRYPIASYSLEIPRGYGESTSTALDAERELREETGLSPEMIVPLGVVYPNSGLLQSRVWIFFATLGNDAAPRDSEAESLVWLGITELRAAAADGEIADAISLSAIARAELRGLLG